MEARRIPDGTAAAVYGQYPPLVNASRPPGEWQIYDIVYTAPRFKTDGTLLSPVHLTVFHNGVLVQNDVQLTGPTSWLERAPYEQHPEKQPISLQDHGNPVRFRNIWIRELGRPGRKEFTLSPSLLDNYVGRYTSPTRTALKSRKIKVSWSRGSMESNFCCLRNHRRSFSQKQRTSSSSFLRGAKAKWIT
jgi:hypothetical protein